VEETVKDIVGGIRSTCTSVGRGSWRYSPNALPSCEWWSRRTRCSA